MAIYKRDRGVELGSTVKKLRLVVRAGFELETSGFQAASITFSMRDSGQRLLSE